MKISPLRPLSTSERLYRALLWCYPKEFRRAYGDEMVQMFRDCYHHERAYGHPWHIVSLWSLVLSDLIRTALNEHCKAFIHHLKVLSGLEKEFLMANTLLNLDVAQRTDIGRRASNEDNMISYVPEDTQVMAKKGALFVVADGLGGYTKGDVASNLSVNTIRDTYYQDANEDIAIALQRAVGHANQLIYAKNVEAFPDVSEEEREKKSMATTCVAAVLQNDRVYVANAGDSLVYVIRSGQIRQIAQNHDLIAEQLRKGEITEQEAKEKGPSNNMITRCIGIKPMVEVYVASEPVQNNDILLLCTDGLWKLLAEDELRSIVEQYDHQEGVERLVARANENGGPDNITAVVVRVSLAA